MALDEDKKHPHACLCGFAINVITGNFYNIHPSRVGEERHGRTSYVFAPLWDVSRGKLRVRSYRCSPSLSISTFCCGSGCDVSHPVSFPCLLNRVAIHVSHLPSSPSLIVPTSSEHHTGLKLPGIVLRLRNLLL